MNPSFYAIHRIYEKEKGKLKLKGMKRRVIISDGRALSDEKLVEKLGNFGIEINKDAFRQMVNQFLSAEEMYHWYFDQEHVQVKSDDDEDWLWICLVVLWERWAPEQPSFEMIDELMQNGYDEQENDHMEETCEMWLKAWKWILKIMDKKNLKTIDDFDEKFRGTQSVWNWVQDVEMELWNAGLRNSKFLKARIEFTGDYLKTFPYEDKNVRRNIKRAFADSHFKLGDIKKAESLYEEWLKQDPIWGWGWIGYSDCYWMDWGEKQDFEKAEEILKRGLAVPQVEDRDHIIDRLVDLYEESDRPEEAKKWLDQSPLAAKIPKVKSVIPSKKRRKKKKKK
jgi:tetratricopeptide (TPR) repeat protein